MSWYKLNDLAKKLLLLQNNIFFKQRKWKITTDLIYLSEAWLKASKLESMHIYSITQK
jgi:hypothetical protein